MPRYFLGLDVGGTKTHALVADEIGRALGFGVGGPGNPQGVGYEGLTRAVVAATHAALAAASLSPDQIAGAGFGIAGFDWPSQRGTTLRALDPLGLHAPLKIVNIVPISIPCTLNGLSLTRV
jgi:N-acetylglucosamine kinase-like BadF-type ATPase